MVELGDFLDARLGRLTRLRDILGDFRAWRRLPGPAADPRTEAIVLARRPSSH